MNVSTEDAWTDSCLMKRQVERSDERREGDRKGGRGDARILRLDPYVAMSARLADMSCVTFPLFSPHTIGFGLLSAHGGVVHVNLDGLTVVVRDFRTRRTSPSGSIGFNARWKIRHRVPVLEEFTSSPTKHVHSQWYR